MANQGPISLFNHLPLQVLVENHIASNYPSFSGVILIGVNDKILFHRSYGFDDIVSSKLVTPDSQFLISSITKQITAALVIKTFKENGFYLHNTIDIFLPSLNEKWAKNVTVHHLLTHTSGVVGFNKELKFSPGEKYDYSNFGFSLLGMILERLKGKKYDELISEFLAKLGMNSTYMTGEGKIKDIQRKIPKLVNGYDKDETGKLTQVNTHRMAFDFPSKGLISNATDLFRWNRLLNQGKILDIEDYSNMVKSHIKISDAMDYGYGLEISHLDKLKEISHNGETHGYLTTVLYYPDYELSVIILSNHFPFYTTWLGSGNEVIICQEQNVIREIVRAYLKDHCLAKNEETPTITFKFNAIRLNRKQYENGMGVCVTAVEMAMSAFGRKRTQDTYVP